MKTPSGKSDLDRSLITAFFIIVVAVLFGFLPTMAVHETGSAVSDALAAYAPTHRNHPAARPSSTPNRGPFVAMQGDVR